jgi:1,4-alpha-glucan branching enzyme
MREKTSIKRRVAFSIESPEAESVLISGDFTEWLAKPLILKKNKNGVWKVHVMLAPGEHQYRFLVDGQWKDDPCCSARLTNPYGSENCVRVVE